MTQPTTWPEFRREVVEPAIARQEYLSLIVSPTPSMRGGELAGLADELEAEG